MKKILILLFVLILAFSLFACDDGETADLNNDKGENGENENLDKDTNDDGENDGQSQTGKPNGNSGLALVKAVIAQFENSASLKVEFSTDVVMSSDSWDENGENYKSSMHGVTVYTATVAKTENGYNLKVDSMVKTDNGSGERVEEIDGVIYFVDGFLYVYNQEDNSYDVTEIGMADTGEIDAAIAQFEQEMDLSTDEVNSLLEAFGVEVISAFNIISGKGSVSANFKPTLDAILGYIGGLDVETKTVEGVVNDILALIDEDLKADMLVDSLAGAFSVTLEEYLISVDEALVSECGMTLQEFYQAIVTDQGFKSYLVSTLLESGMSQADIDAYINSLAKFNINEAIPDEYKKMTMYELTLMLIEKMYGVQEPDGDVVVCEANQEEKPTLDEVVAMVKSVLGMTLKEVEETADIPISNIVYFAKCLTIDAFDYKIDIKLTDVLKIDAVTISFNYGMTMKTPSQMAGKEDVQSVDMIISVKLCEISNKTVEITAPNME